MLALMLIVVGGAVAWFVYRAIKADKDLVVQRQQREVAFLAQHMQRPNAGNQALHGNQQPASHD